MEEYNSVRYTVQAAYWGKRIANITVNSDIECVLWNADAHCVGTAKWKLIGSVCEMPETGHPLTRDDTADSADPLVEVNNDKYLWKWSDIEIDPESAATPTKRPEQHSSNYIMFNDEMYLQFILGDIMDANDFEHIHLYRTPIVDTLSAQEYIAFGLYDIKLADTTDCGVKRESEEDVETANKSQKMECVDA